MQKRYGLLVLLSLLLTQAAFAQFQWTENGVPIRQGAHLGYSGAAIAAGEDVALFYYDCLRDGTRDVWGTRITPAGDLLWGEHGRLVSGNLSEQRAPVAAAYPDGSVLVVWEDYAPGRFRDLLAQRYDAQGNAQWLPASGVTVIEAYRDQFDVRLALNDNGYAFIAFSDDRLTTGAETLLGAYAQILTPEGERVGPLDGIQLVDRVQNYNVPLNVVCVGSDAYILCEVAYTQKELVIQKLLPDGTVGFPDDAALVLPADYGRSNLLALDDALALSWTDRSGPDFYGDARLTLLDLNLVPLPGWDLQGELIATGAYTQTVANMTAAANGNLVLAVADYQFDSDESTLSLVQYSPAGELVWGPIEFGNAELRTSPVDWFWQNDELVCSWVEPVNYTTHVARAQKLSANGVKQWGDTGRTIWSREHKKLRLDLEKPENGSARAVIVSGRYIAQPESLFVGELSATGDLLPGSQFISGGWTYDSYDPAIARVGEDRLAVIWTDNRSRHDRDVYYQVMDAHGQPILEPQGVKLAESDHFSIYAATAAGSDGADGAFLGWIGDSVAFSHVLHVHHIDRDGDETWAGPATIRTPNGYYGAVRLVPDGNGGVFVAFTRFNDSFEARVCVAHIGTSGNVSWSEPYHEFPGLPGSDAILHAAIADGQGGCYLAGITGPWTNTDPVIFHIHQDGSFGDAWTNDGRNYGDVLIRERNPSLLLLDGDALLTYERPLPSSAATYDVRGVRVGLDGSEPWGSNARRLSHEEAVVVKHQLLEDGAGGFLLGFEDFRNNTTHLYAARYDASGTPLWSGTERLVCNESRDQSALTLMHDGRGGAWALWEDMRNSDVYPEIDLYGAHLDAEGNHATVNGFTWPAEGYPVCALPTYQQAPALIPWVNGSALAVWKDLRSSNPGRCCGAGAVGDLFNNIYAQVLSEVSLASPEEDVVTALPTTLSLAAYPNPFNPVATLSFSLPQNATVRLTIYNLLGQSVKTLLDAPFSAGEHVVTWDARANPSGLYFAKLETSAGLSTVRKLTLLK